MGCSTGGSASRGQGSRPRSLMRNWVLGVVCIALQSWSVAARGIQVNLTASWPSSPAYPLLEASEFLAEESPSAFWRFIDQVEPQTTQLAQWVQEGNVAAITGAALDAAAKVVADSRPMLELLIATRTYSAKVEMQRQLALDSAYRTCGIEAAVWAIVYDQDRCAHTVACKLDELREGVNRPLRSDAVDEDTSVCAASAQYDFAMEKDRVWSASGASDSARPRTAIVYGEIGSPSFHVFHNELKPLAEAGSIQYIVRHYSARSEMPTLLQGFGVALDIKNMEYKTIDDSKRSTGEDPEPLDEDELSVDGPEDDDDADDQDEDVDGLVFSVLMEQHGELKTELRKFQEILINRHGEEDEIKAWHLKDMGLAAAREILDAKNPLRRLQSISQDFPKHAKRLAFSRRPLSSEFRQHVESHRNAATQRRLLNSFVINGIPIDPMQRSFNVFDLMNIVRNEHRIGKKMASFPLSSKDLDRLLSGVREINSGKNDNSVRINVRGSREGNAPLYLNDIESDPSTDGWPENVNVLKRPAWNLIFLRKNMYEYVVTFDPLTKDGISALSQISFLRMRGAPLQWGLLISSAELLGCPSKDRASLISKWKSSSLDDPANAWHFAKLLLLVISKDQESGDPTLRMSNAFIDGVLEEGLGLTLKQLLASYVDSTGGSFSKSKNENEALEVLKGDKFDEEVLSMTNFIEKKHLPLGSRLFNGVLSTGLELQEDIMGQFGRDQALYQQMARDGDLSDDMDLVEELLASQETYSSFFSIFDKKAMKSTKTTNFFSGMDDPDWQLAYNELVHFLHPPNSIKIPKKQTLLFSVDLNDAVETAHAYYGVKMALEDSKMGIQVGIIHRKLSDATIEGSGGVVALILREIGHSDEKNHLTLVMEALRCVMRGKSLTDTREKLIKTIEKFDREDSSLKLLKSALQDQSSGLFVKDQRSRLLLSNTDSTKPALFINGIAVDLPPSAISEDDLASLLKHDLKYRTQPIAKVLVRKSRKYSVDEALERTNLILKITAVLDDYKKSDRVSDVEVDHEDATLLVEGDNALRIAAYVDPVSDAAQRMSPLLIMLHSQLNATIELVPVPSSDYGEFPLQRFYRYLFEKRPSQRTFVDFQRLPIKPILTMKIDTPEAWNVQIKRTADDLDNLRVDPENSADVKATKTAEFHLESMLVYGQCRDATFQMYKPPNGLQLVLERDLGNVHIHRDTLVMKNLGYFQLQATPGVWSLRLANGRASELFDILDKSEENIAESMDVIVSDFRSDITQLVVRKRKGKENDVLLEPEKNPHKNRANNQVESVDKVAGVWGSYWDSVMSLFGSSSDAEKAVQSGSESSQVQSTGVNGGRTGETIHVFSLASGHLYERFMKIMMLSVLKRTKNPVTFWLLENFLSPDFKNSIPALRERFGMDIRLVTYKWPNWLRQQTQKQRIIWGYKILFLDVLFPLGVQKIIYVDADQVVRADLKELWEMDLHGAPYAYTPFCDSRNVGFQFWRQGYWKDHLRGKPYHISALYVVDIALFRQMAAGDMLRAIYDQLSADPNSLSNLDQDLPNYAQHQIPIFSLPQEWLWCESWCSDESKAGAKTIDLCNNPKHKEPKLDMAKRVISGGLFPESWLELDQEIKEAEMKFTQSLSTAS